MTNFMSELLEIVEGQEQQRKLELDKLKADQALMAVTKLEAQMSEATKLVDDEIALLENYRKNELERLQKKQSWIVFNLEGFTRQQFEANGEKSIRLPHGTLALRKGRDKVEVLDMASFLKVAARYQLLRTTPEKKEPDLQAIYSHYKSTGQPVIGTRVVPATVNFSYSLTTNGEPTNGTEQ